MLCEQGNVPLHGAPAPYVRVAPICAPPPPAELASQNTVPLYWNRYVLPPTIAPDARLVAQSDCFSVFTPKPAALTVPDPVLVTSGTRAISNPERLTTLGLVVAHTYVLAV